MDEVSELSLGHRVALWMKDRGYGDDQVASLLGIELEAVGPLLRIAHLKLEALTGAEPPTT